MYIYIYIYIASRRLYGFSARTNGDYFREVSCCFQACFEIVWRVGSSANLYTLDARDLKHDVHDRKLAAESQPAAQHPEHREW